MKRLSSDEESRSLPKFGIQTNKIIRPPNHVADHKPRLPTQESDTTSGKHFFRLSDAKSTGSLRPANFIRVDEIYLKIYLEGLLLIRSDRCSTDALQVLSTLSPHS